MTAAPGRHTNRLVHEASPYLQEHARNPVNWYPWGEAAFQRARDEQKPVFLSIGYSSCHWCHVMARESFEDEQIADMLNGHFVPVKVDREERPDIDDVYMSAVQMMTGSGGWPLSVFLTPDLKPFFGGTYFPPEPRGGMIGFPQVLAKVWDAWRERHDDILRNADTVSDALKRALAPSAEEAEGESLPEDLFAIASEALASAYDSKWGGFGDAPKFPSAGALLLLLRIHARTGDEHALRMATHTLDRMGEGGIRDHVGGGFHRYTVDRCWRTPHFEKMLSDNALLSLAYTDAFQLTGNPFYETVVRETLDYVLREMTDANGVFYTAQDAESEGEEGAFYLWNREQVTAVLGPDDADLFCRSYGIEDNHGEFNGRSLPHLAVRIDSLSPEKHQRLADSRQRLLEARLKRPHPNTDDKVLACWNGLTVSALARAAQVLDSDRYREAAEKAADFLLAQLKSNGDLRHMYHRGVVRVDGFLDDYASVANACLDVFEATFEPAWLHHARQLLESMQTLFDGDQGAFFYTSARHDTPLGRSRPFLDAAVPSGNALAAGALMRLSAFAGDKKARKRASAILAEAVPHMRKLPLGTPFLISATDWVCSDYLEIGIVGEPEAAETEELVKSVHSVYLPHRVIACRPFEEPEEGGLGRQIVFLPEAPPEPGAATASVCQSSGTCLQTASDPEALRNVLASWSRQQKQSSTGSAV